jgi:hypothetical protein
MIMERLVMRKEAITYFMKELITSYFLEVLS